MKKFYIKFLRNLPLFCVSLTAIFISLFALLHCFSMKSRLRLKFCEIHGKMIILSKFLSDAKSSVYRIENKKCEKEKEKLCEGPIKIQNIYKLETCDVVVQCDCVCWCCDIFSTLNIEKTFNSLFYFRRTSSRYFTRRRAWVTTADNN